MGGGAVSTKEVRQGSSGRRQGQVSGKSGSPSLAKLGHAGSEQSAGVLTRGHTLSAPVAGVTEVMKWGSQSREGKVCGSPTEENWSSSICEDADAHSPIGDGEGRRTVTADAEKPRWCQTQPLFSSFLQHRTGSGGGGRTFTINQEERQTQAGGQ